MIEIREYLNPDGRNLFGQWFRRRNSDAARRVTTYGARQLLQRQRSRRRSFRMPNRLRSWLSAVFRKRWRSNCDFALRRNEATSAGRHHTRDRVLADLQTSKEERGMALTKDFRETVQARVQRDQKFRRGLLRDAIDALLAGESDLGREILRDYINATVSFPTLAENTGLHVKTLHQMFGPKGNPTAANLFQIIVCLQQHEGVQLRVVT